MADTMQGVKWTLERKCAFREWDEWSALNTKQFNLGFLRLVATEERKGRVLDNILVTRCSHEPDSSGKQHPFPIQGIEVEQLAAQFGGLTSARATCQNCEANVPLDGVADVAGCFGSFYFQPHSEELEDELWRVINERQLEQRLRTAFPVTTPLWFGFWINSPLRREQTELLIELFDHVFEPGDHEDSNLRHFVDALRAALRWHLPVHVALSPPGHTDFGVTTYGHCPRCKAEQDYGGGDDLQVCRVCGQPYIATEEFHDGDEAASFDEANALSNFDRMSFQSFARRYLIQQGATPQQAEEVIDIKDFGPFRRRVNQVIHQRKSSLARLKCDPSLVRRMSSTIRIQLTEGLDLEFVEVPAGEFLMGAAVPDECGPEHIVQIERPFYMSRFVVTQAQWLAVMGCNPSRYRAGLDLPVDEVNWLDCQQFCERLCRRHGFAFRLPSEAEWEYACRAGTSTAYAFGDKLTVEQANFLPRELMLSPAGMKLMRGEGVALTCAGRYPANEWGLYDMHGNVNEWCEDVFHDNYSGAPTDGSAWVDDETSPFRVVRGGCCKGTAAACTSFARRSFRVDEGSIDTVPNDDPDDFDQSVFRMSYLPIGCRVVCEFHDNTSTQSD